MAKKRIKELPDFDRPQEKLAARGAEALSDIELLAILLGSGLRGVNVLELATKALRMLGDEIKKPELGKLESVKGIGKVKACRVVAAFELARRYLLKGRITIREAEDVLPFLQRISDKKQEHFLCLSLNGANEVIQSRVVTVGLLNSNQVHPREVFTDPIADRAASVIVAHNHPSGVLEPSREDVELTKRLVQAGRLLGIEVLDHIIVSDRGYLSLKGKGLI
jgi:DNA repair protein RadC